MLVTFKEMLGNIIEFYVIRVVKMIERKDYLENFQAIKLMRHQIKMKTVKCALRITSDKLLGFAIKHRRIEIDKSKIKAVIELVTTRNLLGLFGLQEHLAIY